MREELGTKLLLLRQITSLEVLPIPLISQMRGETGSYRWEAKFSSDELSGSENAQQGTACLSTGSSKEPLILNSTGGRTDIREGQHRASAWNRRLQTISKALLNSGSYWLSVRSPRRTWGHQVNKLVGMDVRCGWTPLSSCYLIGQSFFV